MFEERIFDSRVEFSLEELLGIAKKEFHDLLMDLVKRKRQSTEENTPRVNANTVLMNDTEVEDEHSKGECEHCFNERHRSGG